MTNHSYFNLGGHDNNKEGILEHFVHINAIEYTPVDENKIPTGELGQVQSEHALDFTTKRRMKAALRQLALEKQMPKEQMKRVFMTRQSETPFGFTREVEWNDDLSQLIVTDSGCENSQADCDRAAQILAIDLPILSEAGTSGAFSTNHEHQRLIELEVSHTLVTPTVELPFDTDRIPLENQGAALRKGLGGCESP